MDKKNITFNPGSLHSDEDIAATAENLSQWKPRKGEQDDSIIELEIIGGLTSRINALFKIIRVANLKGLNVSTAKVLEVGCGYGDGLRPFILNEFKVENLTGIDLMPSRLEVCKVRCPGANYLHMSGHDMKGIENNQFDIVSEQFAFCHIPNEELKRKIALEMMRVVKPGGFILIMDWRLTWRKRNIFGPSTNFLDEIFKEGHLTKRIKTVPTHIWPNIGNKISKYLMPFYPLFLSLPPLVGARCVLYQYTNNP